MSEEEKEVGRGGGTLKWHCNNPGIKMKGHKEKYAQPPLKLNPLSARPPQFASDNLF